jgi:hypothetical protein
MLQVMEVLLINREQWVDVDPDTKPTSMSKEDWETKKGEKYDFQLYFSY